MIVAVIQARIGSQRFPGKMLAKIAGVPMIQRVITATKQFGADVVVLAVPFYKEDRVFAEYAAKNNIECYYNQNPERLYDCYLGIGKKYGATHLVRICADNPFLDQGLNLKLLEAARESDADYIGYSIDGHLAIFKDTGFCAEVMRYDALLRMAPLRKNHMDTVTSVFYMNGSPKLLINADIHGGFCVDYPEDADRCNAICEELGHFPKDYTEVLSCTRTLSPR